MKPFWSFVLSLCAMCAICTGQAKRLPSLHTPEVEVTYDKVKDRTTVRLAPVLVAQEQGKYRSLHMSPSFSFPDHEFSAPSIIDFELQTIVKGRLRTDLYVVFVIDGETVFLSSNRWAIKRPVPGRVWVGERLVFRMPYEIYLRITKAKTFEIKFDGVTFSVGEDQKKVLGEFVNHMKVTQIISKPLLAQILHDLRLFPSGGRFPISSRNQPTQFCLPGLRQML